MADGAEGAGFWLPSEFFDDCLMDKENLDKNQTPESDSEFCFPTEFPYDFGTKSDEHLEKQRVMSTSPQSTLSNMEIWAARSAEGSSNGSPNGFPSPPTTPSEAINDAVGDLIYVAAGRVAKLKLSGGGMPGSTEHKGLLGPPKKPNPSVIHNIYVEQQKQGYEMWYSEPRMYQMRSGTAAARRVQDAWPVHQDSGRIVGTCLRAVPFGGGAAVKRECAGTGVFLPRRYGNNVCNAYSSDSRKRPGYPSASFQNRNVHVLNNNFNNVNGFPQSQPHFQPKFNRGLISDYDLLMAKRNAIMLQHRSSVVNCGAYLPQEWTY